MPKLKNKAEKARFLLVGASATTLDFCLLFVFRYLFNLPVIPANIGSTGIAFCFSFFANKKYTFRSNGSSVIREMILFAVVTLFGLWVIQSIIIDLLSPILDDMLSNHAAALFAAKLIATGVTMVWNYVLYSRVVFSARNRPAN